jgi:hypothetical protein
VGAPNLRGIFDLSRAGLRHVFVHPVRKKDPAFLNALEGLSGNRLAREILTTAEARFANVPAALLIVIQDVFDRPYRCELARDIAQQSDKSKRALYRRVRAIGFGRPRELLKLAKVIGGFSYEPLQSFALWGILTRLTRETRAIRRHFSGFRDELPPQLNKPDLVRQPGVRVSLAAEDGYSCDDTRSYKPWFIYAFQHGEHFEVSENPLLQMKSVVDTQPFAWDLSEFVVAGVRKSRLTIAIAVAVGKRVSASAATVEFRER